MSGFRYGPSFSSLIVPSLLLDRHYRENDNLNNNDINIAAVEESVN